jgi:hypothetical protein
MGLWFVSADAAEGYVAISVRDFDAPLRELTRVEVRLGDAVLDLAEHSGRQTTDEAATRDAAAAWAMDQIRDLEVEKMPTTLDASAAVVDFVNSATGRFIDASPGKPLS